MPVLHTLAAISRFIRRAPPPSAELLEAYAHEVIPVLDRAEWLYEYWLEQSTLFTDGEKLGNVAAIHRWEIATMGRSLERVIPPSALADAHERIIDALDMASRAAQLLSNGSRFHNANAVCEGLSLLTASRERRLAALRSMRHFLAQAQPAGDMAPVQAPGEAAASPTPGVEVQPPALPPDDPAADSVPPVEGATGSPDTAEPDALWTDADEPEPAWLSAARADESSSDGPAIPPASQPAVSDSEAPPDNAAAEPPAQDGWGGLFGKAPDQPGR